MRTKEEKIAILKQQGNMTMKELAAKTGVGLSTLTYWKAKFNGKAKRKVAVKAKPVTRKQEDEWENLYNDFIAKRDAATEARKKLVEYVEQLR